MHEELPEDEIFKIVEQMPLFPGAECGAIHDYAARKTCADQAMLAYIYQRIAYPEKARQAGTEGMAVVRFIIEPDGAMTDIHLVRDPGEGIGVVALKVVEGMQEQKIRWEPGLQKRKPVRVEFNLPVQFKLK